MAARLAQPANDAPLPPPEIFALAGALARLAAAEDARRAQGGPSTPAPGGEGMSRGAETR